MWSPQLISLYLTRKLEIMVSGQGLLKESVEKSLRKYDTIVHPLFRERLEAYGALHTDNDSLTTTKSYSYFQTDQYLNGNRVMNYIFQSMFDHEEPEYGGNVIYLSASTKTIEEATSHGAVMSTLLRNKINELSDINGSPTTLRQLASDKLGPEVVADVLGNDLLKSSLGRHIMDFLQINNFRFPNDQHVNIQSREVAPDLVMTTKYYPGRDDFRAYCRDTNWLRHLCGICLHRLLLPQSIRMRANLERNEVIPAKDKDILNFKIPYPRYNETVLLILGDVSNFTGSLGNAWLMLFCMALQLSQGGSWAKRPNLFSVGGALFTANWYDLIVLYLFLNVGYPAFVEESGTFQNLPGGFLGVAANITIGLVFLSLTLHNLKGLLHRFCRIVHAQAGGDDFAFALVLDEENRDQAVELIREHITNYVGPLKEFHVIDLKTARPGRLGNHTFCKKWIEFTRESNFIAVKGHDNLPIVKSLLPTVQLSGNESVEQWYSYDRNLSTWESIYGHPEQCDTMRKLYSFVYPEVLPLRRRLVKTSLPTGYKVLALEDGFITRKAHDVACTIEDVTILDLAYLSNLSEKVTHCLKASRLTLRNVNRYGENVNLVLCQSEVKNLLRSEHCENIGIQDDVRLTHSLLKLITN